MEKESQENPCKQRDDDDDDDDDNLSLRSYSESKCNSWMEFELTYFGVAFQYLSHYDIGIYQGLFGISDKRERERERERERGEKGRRKNSEND